MKFRDYTLEGLAKMVIGDNRHFPYRSSSHITRFFERCDLNYVHDGSTRWRWTKEDALSVLNGEPSYSPDLPSNALVRVMAELFDHEDFDRAGDGFRYELHHGPL